MTRPNEELVATPTDFFCEHTEQGSRLLVMLHRAGHQPAVRTVLSCTDATATETAARLLRHAAAIGQPPPPAQLEQLVIAMPTTCACGVDLGRSARDQGARLRVIS